jgi:hypothetical protein
VKEQAKAREWLVGLSIALIVGPAMVLGLWTVFDGQVKHEAEYVTFLLDLVQVGGFGGLAALLLERYRLSTEAAQRRVELEEAARQARRDEREAKRRHIEVQGRQMFFETRDAYDRLKHQRRLLQDLYGKNGSSDAILERVQSTESFADALARLGRALIRPQLRLETLKEEAEHSDNLPSHKTLEALFSSMEQRANDVSDALRSGRGLTADRAQLVHGFLDKEQFRSNFTKPYQSAVKILLAEPGRTADVPSNEVGLDPSA